MQRWPHDNYISPLALYRANAIDRIELVRRGLPAHYLQKTAKTLHMSQARLKQILNLPRDTLNRRSRKGEPLSPEYSERLMGLMMLLGQVEEIVACAGDEVDEHFDAGAWLSGWLAEPLPALSNYTASEFMDTQEGQRLISRILHQRVAGAFV